MRYLVHADYPEKKQYDWSEILTNAPGKLESYKIPGKASLDVETKVLIDKIIAGEIKEYEISKIDSNIYIENRKKNQNAFEYRRQILLNDPTRNVTVIVLQGAARLGKSTFCKVLAEKEKKSVFFSSSGRDFFGEYLGQDIAVLDDFDHENIKINDFKKLIDPHIKGAVASRYRNKLFIGETIFICTNQPITDWFPDAKDCDRDAIFERISTVLHFMSHEELTSGLPLSVSTDGSDIPEFSEGVTYYTYNKLEREIICEEEYDKFGRLRIGTKKIYGKWKLKRDDDLIREFDLKKYIDITTDKTAEEDFKKKLDSI